MQLLRCMFFVPCDSWKTLFFLWDGLSLLWDFFNRHNVVFFETSVLEEVSIFRCLHYNSAVLMLMLILSSKKAKLYYTYTYLKNFRSWLFYDNVFYTLYFLNCSTLFFIKLFFYFWKTQNISEDMFLHQYCRTSINSFFIYKRWVLWTVRTKLHIKIT